MNIWGSGIWLGAQVLRLWAFVTYFCNSFSQLSVLSAFFYLTSLQLLILFPLFGLLIPTDIHSWKSGLSSLKSPGMILTDLMEYFIIYMISDASEEHFKWKSCILALCGPWTMLLTSTHGFFLMRSESLHTVLTLCIKQSNSLKRDCRKQRKYQSTKEKIEK